MTDNRVLKDRPPPINDEETHLSRRQQETLSQLHSGHRKLMYLKKQMMLTDSSSSSDSGIKSQDVPHLFNCTAHPTDMSPVNL